jgi:hypothetical protein
VSKLDKLKKKLFSGTSEFTYPELRALLIGLGYTEIQGGRTSGSRVAFINSKNKHIIRLHKPHPGNKLKHYQRILILKELQEQGLVEK